VALDLDIALDEAQWTRTITLFSGAVTAPVLGRLGAGSQRQETILGTLALVALGGLLTAVPAPFGVLVAGRGLQGLGLGVIPLLMSLARDTLPADRARKTIATVSVASTVGIGVAYPLMGFISEAAGL
ncbi:MFS transporter, partial [Burkholderia multivorans]